MVGGGARAAAASSEPQAKGATLRLTARPTGATGAVRERTGRRLGLGTIRVILVGAVALDTSEVFFQAGRSTAELGADLLQGTVGLVLVAVLLWWRARTALVLAFVLGALVLLRGQLVGVELWSLVIGLVAGLSRGGAARAVVTVGVAAAAVLLLPPAAGGSPGGTWPIAAVLAACVGVGVRILLSAQRRTAGTLEAEQREVERARRQVRAEIAADVGAVVQSHLSLSMETLGSVAGAADLPSLRRAVDVVNEDTRTALRALRILLRTLDETEDEPEVDAVAEPELPLGYRILTWARSDQIRIGAAALAVLLGGRLALHGSEDGWAGVVPAVATVLAVGLSILWVRTGWFAALAATVLVLVLPAPLWCAFTVPALLAAIAAVAPRIPTVSAAVLATVVLVVEHVGRPAGAVLAVLGAGLGAILGIWLAHHDSFLSEARERLDAVRAQRRGAATAAREEIAREMHDIMGHELSLVALHTLRVQGSDDAVEIRQALDAIGSIVDHSRASLDSAIARITGSLTAEADVVLSNVARGMAGRLTELGFDVRLRVDPDVDAVDEPVARAAARVLQEATTNVLRHAPPDARCDMEVLVTGPDLVVRLSNSIRSGERDRSAGRGLRGIVERAHILHGSAGSGARGGRWSIVFTVPVRSEPDAAFPDDPAGPPA
jgi:signal transduction histidine kinase